MVLPCMVEENWDSIISFFSGSNTEKLWQLRTNFFVSKLLLLVLSEDVLKPTTEQIQRDVKRSRLISLNYAQRKVTVCHFPLVPLPFLSLRLLMSLLEGRGSDPLTIDAKETLRANKRERMKSSHL